MHWACKKECLTNSGCTWRVLALDASCQATALKSSSNVLFCHRSPCTWWNCGLSRQARCKSHSSTPSRCRAPLSLVLALALRHPVRLLWACNSQTLFCRRDIWSSLQSSVKGRLGGICVCSCRQKPPDSQCRPPRSGRCNKLVSHTSRLCWEFDLLLSKTTIRWLNNGHVYFLPLKRSSNWLFGWAVSFLKSCEGGKARIHNFG